MVFISNCKDMLSTVLYYKEQNSERKAVVSNCKFTLLK